MPQAPDPARHAVRAVLDPQGPPPVPPRLRAEATSAVLPHETYRIDLEDLVDGRGVRAARPTGWRWLLRRGNDVVGAVEIDDEPGGRARVTQGPFVDSTAAALAAARTLPQVTRGRYEPRLLHVPGLYMCALWLADLDGWRDLLIPLAPAPTGVQAQRPYPAAELVPLLAGRARRLLAAAEV